MQYERRFFKVETHKRNSYFTSTKVNTLENRKLGELIDSLFFLVLSLELPFYDLAYDSNIFQFLNIALLAFLMFISSFRCLFYDLSFY